MSGKEQGMAGDRGRGRTGRGRRRKRGEKGGREGKGKEKGREGEVMVPTVISTVKVGAYAVTLGVGTSDKRMTRTVNEF